MTGNVEFGFHLKTFDYFFLFLNLCANEKNEERNINHTTIQINLKTSLKKQTKMSQAQDCKKKIILEQFSLYAKMLREQKKNRFKINAAQSIVKGLQMYPHEICNETDITTFLQYIGKKKAHKTVLRMTMILEKGCLEEVTSYFATRDNTTYDILDSLTAIYGIGPAKARFLHQECSISSLDDLIERVASKQNVEALKLTSAQQLGIRHHADLVQRIPRKEIQSYEKKIRKALHVIDTEITMCIAGSYRRGAKNSGDIDILLSGPNEINMKNVVHSISNMIVGVLAQGDKKAMILSRLTKRSRVRHMDIIITSPAQFPFAQLYFTGSKEFNIRMRKHALQKGYSLNEYDLTVVKSGTPTPPEMSTETDIFNFLEFEFVEPTNRESV